MFQVEWIQQQVVKRRIKRDYKQVPPVSLSSPAYSSPAQNNIFYNDPKWSSMWYIVSTLYTHTRQYIYGSKTRRSEANKAHYNLVYSSHTHTHIYAVCGSKVTQGHGRVLITSGSVELRDLYRRSIVMKF